MGAVAGGSAGCSECRDGEWCVEREAAGTGTFWVSKSPRKQKGKKKWQEVHEAVITSLAFLLHNCYQYCIVIT